MCNKMFFKFADSLQITEEIPRKKNMIIKYLVIRTCNDFFCKEEDALRSLSVSQKKQKKDEIETYEYLNVAT